MQRDVQQKVAYASSILRRGLLGGLLGVGVHVQILRLDLDVLLQLLECGAFSLFALVFILVGVLFRVRVVVLVLVDLFLSAAEVTRSLLA